MRKNLALKGKLPRLAALASAAEEGGPVPQLPAARGGPCPQRPEASALQPEPWRVNIALTHRPRGPRRPTWCRRWGSCWPPACRDTRSPQWLSPTQQGVGLFVSNPQAVSRLGQPGHPPMLGWADKSVLQCQEPVRLVDNSGHCPPLPGASPRQPRNVAEELRHPRVHGGPLGPPCMGTQERLLVLCPRLILPTPPGTRRGLQGRRMTGDAAHRVALVPGARLSAAARVLVPACFLDGHTMSVTQMELNGPPKTTRATRGVTGPRARLSVSKATGRPDLALDCVAKSSHGVLTAPRVLGGQWEGKGPPGADSDAQRGAHHMLGKSPFGPPRGSP